MIKTKNNKKQLTEEEIDKKLYDEADFEGKVDLVYYKALEHYEKKKTIEFLRDNNHDTEKLFNYKNGQLKKDIKKIKSKYYKLARQTVEILESGDFSNVYKKGPFWYYYKKNSRAEEQRNRRTVNKRPKNISKDYTNFIYNKYTDKDGKILRVLDQKRAEDLVWMLDYQFKIKFTILTFFIYGMEEALKANKIEDIKDYILQGKIDLSRGIYANQIHHVDLCRKTYPYLSGQSDEGMYEVVKHKMKQNYYLICYLKTTKNGRKTYVNTTNHLDLIWNKIDYDRMILLVKKEPQGKGSPCWNEDYDGRWLQLGKLTTREEAKDFETRNHVERPLQKLAYIKSQIDSDIAHNALVPQIKLETAEDNQIFHRFSYKRVNELLKTGEIIKIICKYHEHLINKENFLSFKNQIQSCIQIVGDKLSVFYSKLVYSILIRLAKALNLNIEDRFLKKNIFDVNYYSSYKELFSIIRNSKHKRTEYERFLCFEVDVSVEEQNKYSGGDIYEWF